jgi:hypothetical protein
MGSFCASQARASAAVSLRRVLAPYRVDQALARDTIEWRSCRSFCSLCLYEPFAARFCDWDRQPASRFRCGAPTSHQTMRLSYEENFTGTEADGIAYSFEDEKPRFTEYGLLQFIEEERSQLVELCERHAKKFDEVWPVRRDQYVGRRQMTSTPSRRRGSPFLSPQHCRIAASHEFRTSSSSGSVDEAGRFQCQQPLKGAPEGTR